MADNNNDVFQCTVTIQPLTPSITGSSGNDSLTLSVAGKRYNYSLLIHIYVVPISELTQDNFRIVLDIPSTPTAGEVATPIMYYCTS